MTYIKSKSRNSSYGQVERGTSLTIPVVIKTTEDLPINLTDTTILFTVKKDMYDNDIRDDRAYVAKNLSPQEPALGRFFIQLSSQDMDFAVGDYYFDIEILKADGAVYRACTLGFSLVGGPSNRAVNPSLGELGVGEEVSIVTLENGTPIVIVAPAVSVTPSIYDEIKKIQDILLSQQAAIELNRYDIEVLQDREQYLTDEVEKLITP